MHSAQCFEYRFAFNGMEQDDEVKGEGNSYDFGARIYDSRLGRWMSTDPHQTNYAGLSSYNFVANNPIIYVDMDGKDLVYFDEKGTEIARLKSDTRFEAYVKVADGSEGAMHSEMLPLVGSYMPAPMPNIIQTKDGTPTTDPKYQKFDYQIAAATFIFNQTKDETQFVTDGDKDIPSLDPTIVKIVAMQETTMGTDPKRPSDIMSSNVDGDWGDWKLSSGVTRGVTPDPALSIAAGIYQLTSKGFKADPDSYDWNPSTSWLDAATTFNGGGTDSYESDITDMFNNSVPGTASNYDPDYAAKQESNKPIKTTLKKGTGNSGSLYEDR